MFDAFERPISGPKYIFERSLADVNDADARTRTADGDADVRTGPELHSKGLTFLLGMTLLHPPTIV